jgi:hypothetical protein
VKGFEGGGIRSFGGRGHYSKLGAKAVDRVGNVAKWTWSQVSDILKEQISGFHDLHPDYGGDVLLRNVGSYKSHMESHARRRHSS